MALQADWQTSRSGWALAADTRQALGGGRVKGGCRAGLAIELLLHEGRITGENVELVVSGVHGACGKSISPYSPLSGSVGKQISTHWVLRATRGRCNGGCMRRPHLQVGRAEPAVHPRIMSTSNGSRTHSRSPSESWGLALG